MDIGSITGAVQTATTLASVIVDSDHTVFE